MLLNTFSGNKRRKNCEGSKWWSQSSVVWHLAMSCLDAKISLVPKHQFIVPSTLLAPATEIRTHKAMKVHTLRQLTYELFFQNSSKITSYYIHYKGFLEWKCLECLLSNDNWGASPYPKKEQIPKFGSSNSKRVISQRGLSPKFSTMLLKTSLVTNIFKNKCEQVFQFCKLYLSSNCYIRLHPIEIQVRS